VPAIDASFWGRCRRGGFRHHGEWERTGVLEVSGRVGSFTLLRTFLTRRKSLWSNGQEKPSQSNEFDAA